MPGSEKFLFSILNDPSNFNIQPYQAAMLRRLRKANKYAKQIAHGGWGEKARLTYLDKFPEARTK